MCSCIPGYTPQYTIGQEPTGTLHAGGECVECVSGKYKSLYGTMACSECPVGYYTSPPHSSNWTQCLKCPIGAFKISPGNAPCQGPFFGNKNIKGYRDGKAALALFNTPRGIAHFYNHTSIDKVVFVADSMNHVIRILHNASGALHVSTFAGTPTVASFADGSASSAKFNQPVDVMILRAKFLDSPMLVVSDSQNHRIRLLNLSTGHVSTLAGTGASGELDGSGTKSTFNYPSAAAGLAGSQVVWIADMYNSAIRRLDLRSSDDEKQGEAGQAGEQPLPAPATHTNKRIKCWVSTIHLIDSSGKALSLLYPFGLALAPLNEASALYISDQYHSRLIRVDISAISGHNYPGLDNTTSALALSLFHSQHLAANTCGHGNTCEQTQILEELRFAYPQALAFTSSGHLIVAESNTSRLRIVQHMHVNQSVWTSRRISTLPSVKAASLSSAGSRLLVFSLSVSPPLPVSIFLSLFPH